MFICGSSSASMNWTVSHRYINTTVGLSFCCKKLHLSNSISALLFLKNCGGHYVYCWINHHTSRLSRGNQTVIIWRGGCESSINSSNTVNTSFESAEVSKEISQIIEEAISDQKNGWWPLFRNLDKDNDTFLMLVGVASY